MHLGRQDGIRAARVLAQKRRVVDRPGRLAGGGSLVAYLPPKVSRKL
jgi:hypothetical protein